MGGKIRYHASLRHVMVSNAAGTDLTLWPYHIRRNTHMGIDVTRMPAVPTVEVIV